MLDEEMRQILLEELDALRKRIIDNMGKAGQIVTGKTRDSMQVEVRGNMGVLTGRRAHESSGHEFPRKYISGILQLRRLPMHNIHPPR